MNDGLYIALLNPSITLVLATAFLVLWLHQRHRGYVALLARGYAASAGGFLLQYFVLPIGHAGDEAHLEHAVLYGRALHLQRGDHALRPAGPGRGLRGADRWRPWRPILVPVVDPDITWRIYAINFALGGISLLLAAERRP